MNKKKIFNDPVYGFITIPGSFIFDIIEHPYFQRLRRIKQLGLTDLVYPGALHTRFHHALGAMHLMGMALNRLRSRGHQISEEEKEAALAAILLHDIGHGPFSHALEKTLLSHIAHEKLSYLIMEKLNKEFNGKLDLTIKMFLNLYERKFFHQLISSQLDMDRMDYLKRDSFFTGVMEGTIGADRIIKMLDIVDDELVVEEKGIYSIENFLSSRRLMYWQVYLHKTTVCAEKMLIQIIRRAQHLSLTGENLFASEALNVFLQQKITLEDFTQNHHYLQAFTSLDDYDLWGAIKIWKNHKDPVLSLLCNQLLERKLFRIEISRTQFEEEKIEQLRKEVVKNLGLPEEHSEYFVVNGVLRNRAYLPVSNKINVLTKRGQVLDVAQAYDLPNIKAISKIVKKHYLCWPKNVSL
ncbi:MAG: HD domain-containing protein [Sporocytophaga sp.]|uniref:HD domain-containing protein n=1 Tax=Sporocytophaga sp. TaxID=2231183 RepID=UPI001B0F855C|nr:HD domain-containing protein [Sporocytophaga sp.]MBO9700971.1 HD domain-containing protein [Sporocytophaga sp.]